MPKQITIKITLTPEQQNYLKGLGGNTSKKIRDAIRCQFPDFPDDPPFGVRRDYLRENPALSRLRLTPEFIQAIQPQLSLYKKGDVSQLDFITEKYQKMGYSPGDISSDEMLQLLIREGLVTDQK